MALAEQNPFSKFAGLVMGYGVLYFMTRFLGGEELFLSVLLPVYFLTGIVMAWDSARSNPDQTPGECFQAAIAALMMFGFIASAPGFGRIAPYVDTTVWMAGVGMPLGVGAMALWRAEKLSPAEIIAGLGLGVAGAMLALILLWLGERSGLHLYVPPGELMWNPIEGFNAPIAHPDAIAGRPESHPIARIAFDGVLMLVNVYRDVALLSLGVLIATFGGSRLISTQR